MKLWFSEMVFCEFSFIHFKGAGKVFRTLVFSTFSIWEFSTFSTWEFPTFLVLKVFERWREHLMNELKSDFDSSV
jgi:hypothetical protein